MNPVDLGYWPAFLLVPIYLLLCSDKTSGPIAKAIVSVLKTNALVQSVLWTIVGVLLLFCMFLLKSAWDQPFRTDYREGALVLGLDIVLIVGIQNLSYAISQRNAMVIDRDMMKKQSDQVASFAKSMIKEDDALKATKAAESKMPKRESEGSNKDAEKEPLIKEDEGARKRK